MREASSNITIASSNKKKINQCLFLSRITSPQEVFWICCLCCLLTRNSRNPLCSRQGIANPLCTGNHHRIKTLGFTYQCTSQKRWRKPLEFLKNGEWFGKFASKNCRRKKPVQLRKKAKQPFPKNHTKHKTTQTTPKPSLILKLWIARKVTKLWDCYS